MKKFFAILIVALLASSYAFSAVGTGTVNVTVSHPPVTVAVITSPADQAMVPNSFVGNLAFVFQATGAWGIPVNTYSVAWGGSDVTKVYATLHTDSNFPPAVAYKSFDGPFTGGNLTNITADFGIYCAPGTAAVAHTVTCTITVDY